MPCTARPERCFAPPGAPRFWLWADPCSAGSAGANYNDITDDAPLTEALRFRLHWENDAPPVCDFCGSGWVHTLAPMLFGSNEKSEIRGAIDAMQLSNWTRINVGLMWGWFALSPKWQGMWDAGKPGLPAPYGPNLDKAIVLMTDGKNVNTTGPLRLNDDLKTAALCDAIKAQGITIYAVGFGAGGEINETLLTNCASNTVYYFHAPTEAELRTVFRKIADDILFNTLRLSK
jgi:hypothetical protein